MDIDFKEYQLRCQLRGHEDDVRSIISLIVCVLLENIVVYFFFWLFFIILEVNVVQLFVCLFSILSTSYRDHFFS